MNDPVVLDTPHGAVTLRAERTDDAWLLYELFRSHALPELDALPADEAIKESLVRMQFNSQTATYRSEHPGGRFSILERAGAAIGRLVVDEADGVATIVDIAMLPVTRGAGLGSAVMVSVVAWLSKRCPVMRCTVLFTNTASLRMCERAGFVRVTDTPPHVGLEWRSPA